MQCEKWTEVEQFFPRHLHIRKHGIIDEVGKPSTDLDSASCYHEAVSRVQESAGFTGKALDLKTNQEGEAMTRMEMFDIDLNLQHDTQMPSSCHNDPAWKPLSHISVQSYIKLLTFTFLKLKPAIKIRIHYYVAIGEKECGITTVRNQWFKSQEGLHLCSCGGTSSARRACFLLLDHRLKL